jgi:heme/copper-type cytochrome/quinol oxidase subunit 2
LKLSEENPPCNGKKILRNRKAREVNILVIIIIIIVVVIIIIGHLHNNLFTYRKDNRTGEWGKGRE